MKNYFKLLFVLISLLFLGCEKEPLPILPEGNNPIYTLRGLVNGDSLKLNVGLQNVVLNVGVDESSNVLTYYGEMENMFENERFRIEFIQHETPVQAGQHQVFTNLTIPFLIHERGKVSFDFGGVGNQINNFEIRAQNGNFVATDVLEIPTYGMHDFAIRFGDYGPEVFNFQVKHGYEERLLDASFNVQGSENEIFLDAFSPTFQHEWYIAGQLVGTAASYSGPIEDGISEILHSVTDENGNSSISSSLVRFKGGKYFWTMKLNYQPEYDFEPYNYGRAVISMFKNDKWYRSSFALSNKFEQITVDEMVTIDDVTGQFISFNLTVDAVLKTEDLSDSLVLSNINGKFLIGLP